MRAVKDVTGRTWVDSAGAHSSVTTWVPCDPATCFDYIADFSRHSEWTTNPVEITSIGNGRAVLGARYRPSDAREEGTGPQISKLRSTTALREFTATGGPIGTPEGDPHRHRFIFKPEADGTRIELLRTDPGQPCDYGLAVEMLVHPDQLRKTTAGPSPPPRLSRNWAGYRWLPPAASTARRMHEGSTPRRRPPEARSGQGPPAARTAPTSLHVPGAPWWPGRSGLALRWHRRRPQSLCPAPPS